ncbi:hypothetical protein, partial [Sicyoidochytrium minutum DNA virus]
VISQLSIFCTTSLLGSYKHLFTFCKNAKKSWKIL